MTTVWFEGLDELNTIAVELEAAVGGVGAKGSAVLRRYALEVEALAKVFCPVDTGNLKSSIGPPAITGDGRFGAMSAEITAHANYALYVETGTRSQAPQAFMGPALDRVGPSYVAAVAALGDPLGGGRGLRGMSGGGGRG